MITFKRNPTTGEVQAYKDGKPMGPVVTMGDSTDKEKRHEGEQRQERR